MEQELIVTIDPGTALAVFTSQDENGKPNGADALLAKIRGYIDAFEPDISTAKGRAEVASMAFKVAKAKTALEAEGKKLADAQKEVPKKIDACRKLIKDTLDSWRDEVRQPLTAWEMAEEARKKAHLDAIGHMNFLTSPTNEIGQPYDAKTLRECLAWVKAVKIGPHCEEFEAEYARAKDISIQQLENTIAAREKYEAEQIELARLRKEAEERAARDREEEIARKAAQEAEERAMAAAKAEAEKAEAAARAEREKIEAAAKAEREAAERRELQLRLDAEAAELRAKEAEAEALRTEGRLRREAEEQAAAEAAATAAREADREHRAAINRSAVEAFVSGGISDDIAKLVVTLIAKKAIPHVSISY